MTYRQSFDMARLGPLYTERLIEKILLAIEEDGHQAYEDLMMLQKKPELFLANDMENAILVEEELTSEKMTKDVRRIIDHERNTLKILASRLFMYSGISKEMFTSIRWWAETYHDQKRMMIIPTFTARVEHASAYKKIGKTFEEADEALAELFEDYAKDESVDPVWRKRYDIASKSIRDSDMPASGDGWLYEYWFK